jgi:hypothetical protein
VIPALFDGLGCNDIPCLLCNWHTFENVEFINISFTSIIKVNRVHAKIMVIYCLEASNNSHVTWLNKWCHIGPEILEINVQWMI